MDEQMNQLTQVVAVMMMAAMGAAMMSPMMLQSNGGQPKKAKYAQKLKAQRHHPPLTGHSTEESVRRSMMQSGAYLEIEKQKQILEEALRWY